MTILSGWENFYVIMGSSAGALIGLQFVAITLFADMPVRPGMEKAGDSFLTPTIVHFAVVLFLAGVISAPWNAIDIPSILWGVLGVYGVIYSGVIAKRFRHLTVYTPEFEDWLFHVLLPFVAYVLLGISGWIAHSMAGEALFMVAAASIILLFIGIHNAWDSVNYRVFTDRSGLGSSKNNSEHISG